MTPTGVPPWRLRDASDGDHEWAFELHRAALGAYIKRTWGWDEVLQQRLFAEAFEREPGHIIQVADRDVGILVVEEHPEELYLRACS